MTLPVTESLLHRLGWDDGWEAAFAEHRAAGLIPARVAIQHRGAYDLMHEQGEQRASAANRLVREEYEDLITWARDDVQEEAVALERVSNELAARGILRSGEYGFQLRRVRDEFARRWRDRCRGSVRNIAELRESEGPAARAWRRLRTELWPLNPYDEELHRLTAAWEDDELRAEAVRREVERVTPST